MTQGGVDEEVTATVRECGGDMSFVEIAVALAARGITRSRVHNAVYRLGKAGRLSKSGSPGRMRYRVQE